MATGSSGRCEFEFQPFPVLLKYDCPHIEQRPYTLPASARKVNGHQPPCHECHQTEENWVCLQQDCNLIGCSRYRLKHMLDHHSATNHSICLSLSDHSIYCYVCEEYIDHSNFRQLHSQLIGEYGDQTFAA
ncbi:unnamed protein product [Didymodactylos carnosus]|uniref:UBP-type domain-containing protein n=1 Tax=Didymodactylos carnosus TaxID=1234261 RepID=A0A814N482_9BILA|nr:unnamed protein product [Didymodactylos carnosus]CAF1088354.1 unnamed protein product [Didymodactylos carnosus]CAF3682164.1 unnamed protein product [Didymodactylos carnosus]CAF3853893.1 unnamed protein product [Didymodactylos carnosus]